jgi:large subunit ribosomal protein L21
MNMYAIVEIAGQQFKAEAGKKLYVHRLEGNVGDSVSFDRVLLTDDNGAVKVGTHLKDDKVIIYKKKRRKTYEKTQGHRQSLTQIAIESIA